MEQYIQIMSEHLDQLMENPLTINEVTVSLLESLSKKHHPHNKLLPSIVVSYFLEELQVSCFQTEQKEEINKFLLFFNCLRTIIVTNFGQIKDNKIYGALTMTYASSLNTIFSREKRLSKELNQNNQQGVSTKIIEIIRGYVLSEIIFKLIQRTRTCIPEYYKFINFSVEMLLGLLKRCTIKKIRQKKINKIEQKYQNNVIENQLLRIALGEEEIQNQAFQPERIILLINDLTKQMERWINVSSVKKILLQTNIVQNICANLKNVDLKCYEFIYHPFQPKEKQGKENQIHLEGEENPENNVEEEEPIFLEDTIQFRQLTPRFYDEEQASILKNLRRKKSKLTKKIQLDLRRNVQTKLQEKKVREDVKKQKSAQREKKQLFILQKQTEEAKKFHKQMSKVKTIQKKSKGSGSKGGAKGGFKTGSKGIKISRK